MKYTVRLIGTGAITAVISGCATGLDLSPAYASPRQTINFAGSTMPNHTVSTSLEDTNEIALPSLGDNASLQLCLLYASLSSPTLRSAFYNWKASLLRVPQVSALTDPKVSFGYFLEEIQTRTGPMEQQLSLQQSFPWWGLLEAKGEVATSAARKLWHDYESARLTLFERVTQRWTAVVDLEAEIQVVSESFDLLREAERISRRSYEVDSTSHEKLVRLQVELGILEDNLLRLRDLRIPRIASLNALLARDSAASLALPTEIELHVSSSTLEQTRQLLISNPAIQAVEATIEQQEKATRVAELDAKPKWTVGVTYTNLGDPINPATPDAGDSPIMGMLGFSIPLNQEKYDAAKQEAISKRLAAIATKEALFHTLNAALAEAIYRRDDSTRRIEFYESALIPRAEDALTAALTAFSAGKTNAIELLDAQRTLLELQRNLQRSYVAALNADAAISKIIGGSEVLEANE